MRGWKDRTGVSLFSWLSHQGPSVPGPSYHCSLTLTLILGRVNYYPQSTHQELSRARAQDLPAWEPLSRARSPVSAHQILLPEAAPRARLLGLPNSRGAPAVVTVFQPLLPLEGRC